MKPVFHLIVAELWDRSPHDPAIFRTTRPSSRVSQFYYDLLSSDDPGHVLSQEPDVHLIASTLLLYLREGTPLLSGEPFRRATVFASEGLGVASEHVTAGARSILCALSVREWGKMKALFLLLGKLSAQGQVPVSSLAFTFTPLIVRPSEFEFMSQKHIEGINKLRPFIHLVIEKGSDIFAEATSPPLLSPRSQAHAFGTAVDGAVILGLVERSVNTCFRGARKRVVVRHARSMSMEETMNRYRSESYFPLTVRDVSKCGDRRQFVVACHALRAQIKRFEDYFHTHHSHLPKSIERDPVMSSYAQYREWKRIVRDHAATSMQSAVRRFLCRLKTRMGSRVREPLQAHCAIQKAQAERDDLTQRKRDVKRQLKAFDAKFMSLHGRLPNKAEKEEIRDLYEQYHDIKRRLHSSATTHSGDQSYEENEVSKELRGGHQQTLEISSKTSTVQDVDLGALVAEKSKLHAELKNYERQFARTHGRPVQTLDDIKNVRVSYDRYKELRLILETSSSK